MVISPSLVDASPVSVDIPFPLELLLPLPSAVVCPLVVSPAVVGLSVVGLSVVGLSAVGLAVVEATDVAPPVAVASTELWPPVDPLTESPSSAALVPWLAEPDPPPVSPPGSSLHPASARPSQAIATTGSGAMARGTGAWQNGQVPVWSNTGREQTEQRNIARRSYQQAMGVSASFVFQPAGIVVQPKTISMLPDSIALKTPQVCGQTWIVVGCSGSS